MIRPVRFIRRCGNVCSLVQIRADGEEEILEDGLTLAEAEVLYFICIGEPVHEPTPADDDTDDAIPSRRRRPRQLAFKF